MSEIVSTTTHKYPWKKNEIITIAVLALLPVAFYFFMTPISFYIFGGISLALAITQYVLAGKRKRKSTVKAVLTDDGYIQVTGMKFDEKRNKVILSTVKNVKLVERTYHPTLQLSSGAHTLRIPKRLALSEPLNTYIRENFPDKVVLDVAAKPVLDEVLKLEGTLNEVEQSDDRNPVRLDAIKAPAKKREITPVVSEPVAKKAPTVVPGALPGALTEEDKVDSAYSGLLFPTGDSKTTQTLATIEIVNTEGEAPVVETTVEPVVTQPSVVKGQRVQPKRKPKARR